jgi:hypothetical protein
VTAHFFDDFARSGDSTICDDRKRGKEIKKMSLRPNLQRERGGKRSFAIQAITERDERKRDGEREREREREKRERERERDRERERKSKELSQSFSISCPSLRKQLLQNQRERKRERGGVSGRANERGQRRKWKEEVELVPLWHEMRAQCQTL